MTFPMTVTILEWAAFSASIMCSFVYGYRTIAGPLIGVVTAILFMLFGWASGVHAAIAANIIFLIIHTRNGWRIMTNDPKRQTERTAKELNRVVDQLNHWNQEDMDFASEVVTRLAKLCHQASFDAGWWSDIKTGELMPPSVALKTVLIHSEISEAMEGDRKSLQDDKLPHRSMFEVELADTVIRICDIAGRLGRKFGSYFVSSGRQIAGEVVGDIGEDLCRLHYHASKVWKEHRLLLTCGTDSPMYTGAVLSVLGQLLYAVCETAQFYKIDLGGAVAEKMEFNANRPDHKIENRLKGGGKSY